jgi:D-tyrosyl-tRNA(Tyr) deacylase
MICVVQRVSEASVVVAGQEIARIAAGMLVLASVHATDGDEDIAWTARKLSTLRMFAEADRNFEKDVVQIGGSVLLVSNFTVAAETSKGRRPSLGAAAPPDVGREKFDRLVAAVRALVPNTQTGQFGADMKVSLVNDGPASLHRSLFSLPYLSQTW